MAIIESLFAMHFGCNLSHLVYQGFSQFSVHRDVPAPIKVWWGPIRWVTNRMERVEGVHPCDGQGCWLEWGPHCLIRQYHKIDPPKKSPYFGFPIYRDLLHASANQYQTVKPLEISNLAMNWSE